MPKGAQREALSVPQSIPMAQIPEELQGIVANLRSLRTPDQWAEQTKGWRSEYKEGAILCRKKNQTERNMSAREMFKTLASDMSEDPEEPGMLLLALACLSDHQLDMAIATLDNETREKMRSSQ